MNLVRRLLMPSLVSRPVLGVTGLTRHYGCTDDRSIVHSFPRVKTQGNGPQKYVLAAVYLHGEMVDVKYVIRASQDAKYHLHIYDKLKEEASKLNLCTQCFGGGYLEHDPGKGYIKIYGRSKLLGKANHRDTRDILCEEYPTYIIDAEHGGMDN